MQSHSAVKTMGTTLRRVRTERNTSLAELARRAGVAKATLVNLEAGRGNPTVETLWALAGALGVPFGALLADAGEFELRRVRPADASELAEVRVQLVERLTRGGVVELYTMDVPRGGARDAEGHGRGVREHVAVVAGRGRVGPATEPMTVAKGDLLSFPAHDRHVYANAGRNVLRLQVWMDYPPA